MGSDNEDERFAKSQHPYKDYIGDRKINWGPIPFAGAVDFIRKNLVLPLRKQEPNVYYHRKYERVPTVDECELSDAVCRFEANEQFLRDKKVDSFKLRILRRRWTECNLYWGNEKREKCWNQRLGFEEGVKNWYLHYGEAVYHDLALAQYMKQKHRMVWLRRMKEKDGIDRPYNE